MHNVSFEGKILFIYSEEEYVKKLNYVRGLMYQTENYSHFQLF